MLIFLSIVCFFLFLTILYLYREMISLKDDMNFLNSKIRKDNDNILKSCEDLEKDLHEFYDNTILGLKQSTKFQDEVQKFVVLVLDFMNSYNEQQNSSKVTRDPTALGPLKKNNSKPD